MDEFPDQFTLMYCKRVPSLPVLPYTTPLEATLLDCGRIKLCGPRVAIFLDDEQSRALKVTLEVQDQAGRPAELLLSDGGRIVYVRTD